MKKRAAIYVRVSTKEQKEHGISVDNQIDALTQYCSDNGIAIVGIYNDAGISARKKYKNRPALLQLLNDCQNKKIDIILFTKLDRWFRNVGDYYEVQSVLDECKVPWKAIWEDYTTENSEGVFKVNIMLSVAQAEADRTSERIKAVNEFRRANGQYTSGTAPYGYKVVNSKVVIDEEKKEAVKTFFETFLLTYSTSESVSAMREKGLSPSRNTIYRMLRNPAYYGNACGFPCEPYITKEEWERIQLVVGSRQIRSTKKANEYYFTGMIKCKKCGRAYSGKTSHKKNKNGTVNKQKYYVCHAGLLHRCENRKSKTEKIIESFLINNIEEMLKDYNKSLLVAPDDNKNENDKKRKAIQNRIKRIGDRYEMDEITREEYIEKVNALKIELSLIPEDTKKEPKSLPGNWKDIYEELEPKYKRSFWQSVIKTIYIEGDEIEFEL